MSRIDYQDVLERVNEVIQVNVMTAEQGDFLITHMPFANLEVTFSGLKNAQTRSMDEKKVYEELVRDAKDDHRFIIVKGDNGTGKSHLIRWMQARMVNEQRNGDLEDEKIVFIRRIDNTLRGAIKQLLDQGVVTDSAQLKNMQSFIDSVTNMPDAQLKDSILDSFIAQLRDEAQTGKLKILRKPAAEGYVELLGCEPFRKKLMGPKGPINRFFELIKKPSQDVANTSAPRFIAEDFDCSRDKELQNEMLQYQSISRIRNALHDLTDNSKKQNLADTLNGYAETVIQRTAHIGGEDANQIVLNLRRELKKQGKRLTIFIEDMTTFTGIDSELIKILIEGNTGEYADLCRVTSVIGITNAYYDDRFKGNFKDRVTHTVVVDNRSFGDNPETLYDMAARYLNACYMKREEVESWMKDGARADAIPCRSVAPEFAWDAARIGDDDFTLFPFTKRALVTLFERLKDNGGKTPRNFLRAVIREQFVTYLNNQMGEAPFPSVTSDAIGKETIDFVSDSYIQGFEKLAATKDADEKKSFRALLCFWGDGTVSKTDDAFSSLPYEFIRSLKYSFIGPDTLEKFDAARVVVNPVDNGDGDQTVLPVYKKEKVEFPSSLQNQLQDIKNWEQNESATLQSSAQLRKNVSDFLQEAIDWPMEGIPVYWSDLYLRDNKNVYIEGQKERVPTAETALFVLPRNSEVAAVLRGLAIRYTLKNWDFPESSYYQYRISVWLEKNRRTFVRNVSAQDKVESMRKVLEASMAVEYLYLGVMGGFSRDEVRLREKLFRQKNELQAVQRAKQDRRQDEWGKLIDLMSQKIEENEFRNNKEILTRMIKATTGVASASSDNVLVWGEMIEEAFGSLKKAHWDLSVELEGKEFNKGPLIEKPFALLKAYWPKVLAVMEDEKRRFSETCDKLLYYVENPEDPESWKAVVKESLRFLKSLNSLYNIAYPGEMENDLNRIRNVSETLSAIVRNGKAVCSSNQTSSMLVFFSSDPIGMNLMKAVNTFDMVQKFAEVQKLKYEKALSEMDSSGVMDEAVEKTKEKITTLMNVLSEEVE